MGEGKRKNIYGKKITKNGKYIVLLTPSEKGKKYSMELSGKYPLTNDGKYKLGKDGLVHELSESQLAYRSGYLDARQDISRLNKWLKRKKEI